MTRTKKTPLTLALGAIILTGGLANAQSSKLQDALNGVGSTAKSAASSLSNKGQIYVNSTDLTRSNKGFNFKESEIQLDAKLSEALNAQIIFDLQEMFVENLDLNDDIDLNELIKVARIMYDPKDGPVAVIVGKGPQAFGLEDALSKMPAFYNSPLFEERQIRKVKGITVALKYLKGFKAELSIHDQKDRLDELDMNDFNSSTIRVSTTRGAMKYVVSHARSGEKLGDNFDDHEKSGAAAIWTSRDRTVQVWAEAVKESKRDQIGVVAGASKQLGATTIIVEATKIEDLQQIGIGVMVNATKNIAVGAELRYTEDDLLAKSDTMVALAARLQFGAGSQYVPNDQKSLLE